MFELTIEHKGYRVQEPIINGSRMSDNIKATELAKLLGGKILRDYRMDSGHVDFIKIIAVELVAQGYVLKKDIKNE